MLALWVASRMSPSGHEKPLPRGIALLDSGRWGSNASRATESLGAGDVSPVPGIRWVRLYSACITEPSQAKILQHHGVVLPLPGSGAVCITGRRIRIFNS